MPTQNRCANACVRTAWTPASLTHCKRAICLQTHKTWSSRSFRQRSSKRLAICATDTLLIELQIKALLQIKSRLKMKRKSNQTGLWSKKRSILKRKIRIRWLLTKTPWQMEPKTIVARQAATRLLAPSKMTKTRRLTARERSHTWRWELERYRCAWTMSERRSRSNVEAPLRGTLQPWKWRAGHPGPWRGMGQRSDWQTGKSSHRFKQTLNLRPIKSAI